MHVYLAARYSRRMEMVVCADDLIKAGHGIVSTWIDGHHETRPEIDSNGTVEERRSWALEDIHDMRDADTMIVFTDDGQGGRSRGGYRVEMGFMLGRLYYDTAQPNYPVLYLIGPRLCVFDFMGNIGGRFRWWPTWDAFKAEMLQCP